MKQKPCDLCHDSPAALVPGLGYRCERCITDYIDDWNAPPSDDLAPAVGLRNAAILTLVLCAVLGTLAYLLIR